MSSKANQLPKDGKVKTVPPRQRITLPLYLAGGALLVIIIGIVLVWNPGSRSSAGKASPPQVTGQPKLVVDRAQIDFGKVPLDKPVKATFILSNIGDQPLALQGIPVVEVKQGC